MELFFTTIIFLAFCITAIALSQNQGDISALAIKVLGKILGRSSPAKPPRDNARD